MSKGNSIIVGPVRFSYMNVFRPKLNTNNGRMQFSTVVLIPKKSSDRCPDSEQIIRDLNEAIDNAAEDKFGNKVPANLRRPLRDGDAEKNDDGSPKYGGFWFMNSYADEDRGPVLFHGADRRHVLPEDEKLWKSGDWGYVKLNFYGYDQKGNKGVGAGLQSIRFTRHDTPLGGGTTSASEFPEVAVDPDDYDPFAEETP